MPSKKKKFNARFPPARIKKIMQTDEEVGKVAAAVPVIISRALELFVESLLTKAVQITSARNAKTLSPAHLKQCILAESRFDFLKDLVMAVPDVQGDGDEMGGVSSVPSTPTDSAPHHSHPPVFTRSQSDVPVSRKAPGGTGRPRGRPRKNPVVTFQAPAASSSRKATDSDEDEDESDEDDGDDDEDEEEDATPPTRPAVKASLNGASTPSVQFNAVQPNFYQEIGGGPNSSGTSGSNPSQPPALQIQITLPIPTGQNNGGSGGKEDDEDYDT